MTSPRQHGWLVAAAMVAFACGDDAESEGGSGTDAAVEDAATEDASAGGDASVDAASVDAASDDCIEPSLRWGAIGGLVAFRNAYFVDACRTFRIEREEGVEGPVEICSTEVAVDAEISVADINALVSDADVQAALEGPSVVYGGDPRPVDGFVLSIEIDGASILVGMPCEGCTEIPAGVAALKAALEALVEQQTEAYPDCSADR